MANSPFIADLLKKAKKANMSETTISADPKMFRYFHNWLYDKDGAFTYKAHDFYRSENSLGYPFNPLINLYMLAYELRVPSFVNAVLQKIMEVHRETNQVADKTTIELLYREHQQSLPIHALFVDQVSFHVHEDDVLGWENLDFLRAVAHRLVLIRDGSSQKPISKAYFIIDIADPEPEPEAMEEDDDDDDCVIVSSQPAPNPGRASRAPTVKRECSTTAFVEA